MCKMRLLTHSQVYKTFFSWVFLNVWDIFFLYLCATKQQNDFFTHINGVIRVICVIAYAKLEQKKKKTVTEKAVKLYKKQTVGEIFWP